MSAASSSVMVKPLRGSSRLPRIRSVTASRSLRPAPSVSAHQTSPLVGEDRRLVVRPARGAEPLHEGRLHLLGRGRRQAEVVDEQHEHPAAPRGGVQVRGHGRDRGRRLACRRAALERARLEADDGLRVPVLEHHEIVAREPAHRHAGLVEDDGVDRDGRHPGGEGRGRGRRRRLEGHGLREPPPGEQPEGHAGSEDRAQRAEAAVRLHCAHLLELSARR